MEDSISGLRRGSKSSRHACARRDKASLDRYDGAMIPVVDGLSFLDLRGLEPTPERLIGVVRRWRETGTRDLVVDWGGRFPWSLDPSLSRADAYPERVVTAVAEESVACGVRLSIVLRSGVPDTYGARVSYRHVDRARTGRDPGWHAAYAKLVGDLVDDMIALVPGMYGLLVPAGCRDEEIIRGVCSTVGLACGAFPVEAQAEHEAERTGGIEERLQRLGHPARLDRGFCAAHDALRSWREEGWRLVGLLHEELIAAEAEPARRDHALVEAMRGLRFHLRGEQSLRGRFGEVYDGLVPDGAVRRFLGPVSLPLREQHGLLAARAQAVRALR
jgi:hypothetical protein